MYHIVIVIAAASICIRSKKQFVESLVETKIEQCFAATFNFHICQQNRSTLLHPKKNNVGRKTLFGKLVKHAAAVDFHQAPFKNEANI